MANIVKKMNNIGERYRCDIKVIEDAVSIEIVDVYDGREGEVKIADETVSNFILSDLDGCVTCLLGWLDGEMPFDLLGFTDEKIELIADIREEILSNFKKQGISSIMINEMMLEALDR